MPTQSPIQQYYHLQHESFVSHVRAVLEALEKILDIKEDQVTEQQKAAVQGLKALYCSQMVEDGAGREDGLYRVPSSGVECLGNDLAKNRTLRGWFTPDAASSVIEGHRKIQSI